MAADDLVTIGRFAQISGLSIHTLRHYDDVGLLAPAEVDPASAYRRYRRSQVREARLIKALRWIDLPVEEVRAAISDPSGGVVADILRNHRRRLERQQRDRRFATLLSAWGAMDYFGRRGSQCGSQM